MAREVMIKSGEYKGCIAYVFRNGPGGKWVFYDDRKDKVIPLSNYTYVWVNKSSPLQPLSGNCL